MNKAVFLDRDGTINSEKVYLYKTEDFEFTPYAEEAIRRFNELNYKVIVITNQSGIARGFYSEADLSALHTYINEKLLAKNATIDAFYYCPHHPQAVIEKYKIDCNCRKPKPGLFERAIRDFNIDVNLSWAVGDKLRDIEPALSLGIKSALIAENGKADFNEQKKYITVNNLSEFADLLGGGEN
jgi:D-glycero-D-manno-heptose 1,7-bisphosphate phosphatase